MGTWAAMSAYGRVDYYVQQTLELPPSRPHLPGRHPTSHGHRPNWPPCGQYSLDTPSNTTHAESVGVIGGQAQIHDYAHPPSACCFRAHNQKAAPLAKKRGGFSFHTKRSMP